MAEPTDGLPIWATDSGATSEPSALKKAAGWIAEIPQFVYQNWWQNNVYRWVVHFRETFSALIAIVNNIGNVSADPAPVLRQTTPGQHAFFGTTKYTYYDVGDMRHVKVIFGLDLQSGSATAGYLCTVELPNSVLSGIYAVGSYNSLCSRPLSIGVLVGASTNYPCNALCVPMYEEPMPTTPMLFAIFLYDTDAISDYNSGAALFFTFDLSFKNT